jgi:hypothetical protein
VLSCGAFGAWTIDESRHARENIPPPVTRRMTAQPPSAC